MKITNIKFITRTALILAVVVAVQMIGRTLPYNNFIVGPLVNASLIVATAMLGLWGGLIISVASPFTSLINNHAPIATVLMMFAPLVAAGNFIFVLTYHFLKRWNLLAAVIIGAVLKAGFLYAAITVFLKVFSFPKFAEKLMALFSMPQLITALIGGVLALAVVKALE